MIISDLNYLELAEENKVVGGFLSDYGTVFFYEDFKLKKDIKVTTNISGNVATGEADASALGKNTVTQTFTQTSVIQGYGSSSGSTSISATSGAHYHW